jgi:hypothetical protein
MTVESDFLADSGRALVEAARRHRHRVQRRRRVVTVVAGSVLAVVAITSVVVVRHDSAEAGGMSLRITPSNVEISLSEPYPPTAKVVRKLTDLGLVVRTEAVPTGPSRIGVVVGTVTKGSGTTRSTIRVARGETVIIHVGRAATRGESYTVATDSFNRVEPLACLSGPGGSAADLAARVPAGVATRWLPFAGSESISGDDLDGRVVVRAASFGPSEAIVFVEDGRGKIRDNWCD